ncbi:MAG: glycosyltransferase family 2 protein [Lachnospiraceae bacterium]|nr:glycosyltransferase family 2 protein [Lachnospiraceae bacterium]
MAETDVIIPVYKPTSKLTDLLDRLKTQTCPVRRIILINTEKQYFDAFADRGFWERYDNLLVRHVAKEEFDHGGTRNYGVSFSDTPYFIMMTDDALPKDDKLVERLLAPFGDEKVAMSYARQMPDRECGIIESYTRTFNYPGEPRVKSAEDIKGMGIKAFFASNVCAAYRREAFDELKGFCSHTIFNEDMIYARGVLDAGYKIAYASDAKVIHSHNYSGLQQLRRNFDLGVSHAEHPEVFAGILTESEGIRLVGKTVGYLCKAGKPWLIIRLFWQSGCKYLGYFMGKRYRSLPEWLVKRLSMNREYWSRL